MQQNNPGFAECIKYVRSFEAAPAIVQLDPVFQANYSCYMWHIGQGRYVPNPHGAWQLANDRYPWSPLGSLSEINLAVSQVAKRNIKQLTAISARDKQEAGCDLKITINDQNALPQDDTSLTISVKTATGLQHGDDVIVLSDVAFDKVLKDSTSEMVAFVHNLNETYIMLAKHQWVEIVQDPSNVRVRGSGQLEVKLGNHHKQIRQLVVPSLVA